MDLNAPLGLEPPPRSGGRGWILPSALGIVSAGILGLAAYYLASANPRGGEPYAVATIPPAPTRNIPPATAPDPMPTGSITVPPDQAHSSVRVENGVKVVNSAPVGQPRSVTPLVIDVSKALEGRTHSANFMGGGSSTSAHPAEMAPAAVRPRVAILVGGLGLSDGPTSTALETLPAAVDLAFVANDATKATTVATARAKGHEILLQLPMQSAQGTLLGAHTLRTTETPAELTDDVKWQLGRFDGYAAVTNLLGAPVTANRTAMTTVLKAVASHGVPYVDDGTSPRSLATSVGAALGIPTLRADVVLDATSDPAVVDANLERLLTIARTKGAAIGTATVLSDHLGAIARFARQLDARGFALVPVTAIAGGGNLAARR